MKKTTANITALLHEFMNMSMTRLKKILDAIDYDYHKNDDGGKWKMEIYFIGYSVPLLIPTIFDDWKKEPNINMATEAWVVVD